MVDRRGMIGFGQGLPIADERFGVLRFAVEDGAKEPSCLVAVVLALADARDRQKRLHRLRIQRCKLLPVPGGGIRIGLCLQARQQTERAVSNALRVRMLDELLRQRSRCLHRRDASTSRPAEPGAELLDGDERLFVQGIEFQDEQILSRRSLEAATAVQRPGELKRRIAAPGVDLDGTLPDFNGFLETAIAQQQAAEAGQCRALRWLPCQNSVKCPLGGAQPAGLRMALGDADAPFAKIEDLVKGHCHVDHPGNWRRTGAIPASRRFDRAPTFMTWSQSPLSQPICSSLPSLRSLLCRVYYKAGSWIRSRINFTTRSAASFGLNSVVGNTRAGCSGTS